MKKKKQKYCRAPGLCTTKKYVEMARLGRGEKYGRKRAEAGARRRSGSAIHDVICLSVRLLSLRLCLFPVSLPLQPFLFHCLPVLCPAHHPQCRHRRGLKSTALTHNEEYCPVAIFNPLTDDTLMNSVCIPAKYAQRGPSSLKGQRMTQRE